MLAGGLIIALLIALLAATFVVNRVILFFDHRYTIVAIVPDAPLLTAGSKVWIGGKDAGTVESIGFLPHDADTVARVSMHLNLPRKVREQVRADSRVRITTARLVGERVVDIIPGTAAAPALEEGDTLTQGNAVTVAQLTASAARVRAQLDTALVDFRIIMPKVRTRLAETQRIFATLDGAMSEGKQIAADARAGPAMTLMHDPAFTASIKRVRGHVAELPVMFGTLREKSAATAEARAAFARLQLRADTLSTQLARISAMLDSPNGSAARFRQDSALVKALRAARTELDSLIAETRRNPLRFVF
jgi:phospholipid/cholesterol/gamma-HCH transport system substrate-binding protein